MNTHDDLAVTNMEKNVGVKEMPTVGEHQAVLAQAHNIGHETYQGRVNTDPTAVLVFELEQKMTGGQMNGKPMVISDRFPMNMAPGSKLRNMVDAWRAPKPPLSDAEARVFSIRQLLAVPCTLIVLHKAKKNTTGNRAYIGGIARAKPELPKVAATVVEVPKWITEEKEKNRDNQPPPAGASSAPSGQPHNQDDLPF